MNPEMMDRFRRFRYPAVFLLAFGLRAVFLLQWLELPYLGALSSDAWAYDRWALEILDNGLLRHTAFYQSRSTRTSWPVFTNSSATTRPACCGCR